MDTFRIQFIICGWWFDEFDGRTGITDFIDQLAYINQTNDNIDVFWACHKEPTQLVKDNFKWKLYENVGLEWGAYDKAFKDLDIADDTFVFCMQDDIVIKDWQFVNACIAELASDKIKIVGNGFNYPFVLEPQSEARLSYWLKTNDKWIDYVKPENRDLFQEPINCLSIRGSFLATRYKHIKQIRGFEYVNKPLQEGVKEDGTRFLLIDPFGNTSLYMNAYKFTKYFGQNGFKWLSNVYRKSEWIVECGRGNIDLPQDSETLPFNIPQSFLIDGYAYEEDQRS